MLAAVFISCVLVPGAAALLAEKVHAFPE
jgi:hypothetical protein